MALINTSTNIGTTHKNNIYFEPIVIKKEIDNTNFNTLNTQVSMAKSIADEESYSKVIEKQVYPISGSVWLDLNNNGIKDKKDIVLKDIEIELFSTDNLANPISTVKTDYKGYYEFKDIKLNNYFIKVKLRDNYKVVNKGEYSSINCKTLLSDIICNDRENKNILIGLKKYFKLCGVAFFNYYDTPLYEKYSEGINNLDIDIYDKDNNIIDSTTTSKYMILDGYYEFNNLSPGVYKMVFKVPKNLQMIKPINNNFFESKTNKLTNKIIVNIPNKNVVSAFIGFTRKWF
ncbi:SdrD B-like domain-containing protein [Clostridium uliginosum]|uniref:SD-repeat containing protein B domain-containing protein n=1 Tax=Clostridium uliginosum TaxID=119641 RepID=A0A1I1N4P6_9CLOT|nr:SdrD B-like domain-containing protein [Clostridium uliginosum]SFC90458.1 hypothetical protein SAMN05421842_1138 [Clostridium uliginosum]